MNIYVLLPPELFGCRRTTCSRVSLIIFSSSSSDRASAISPVFFFFFLRPLLFLILTVVLLPFYLGENGAGSKQRPQQQQQQHYSFLCFVVAKVHQQLGTSSPKHRQLYSPKRLPRLVKQVGSVFNGVWCV